MRQRGGLPGPYELHPREHYTYQLRGVVVHTGTANQGHYLSYIRDPDLGEASQFNPHHHRHERTCQRVGAGNAASSSSGSRANHREKTGESELSSGSGEEAADGFVETSEADCLDPCQRGGKNGPVGGCKGLGNVGKQTWCEFNDTIVKEWEVAGRRDTVEGSDNGRIGGLEIDCFGGQQTMQVKKERKALACCVFF